MDYSKSLTKEETEEFSKVLHEFPADEKTQSTCLKYYNEYKSVSGTVSADKIFTAMKCAFFVAEKSQVLYDVKGQRIKGVGLSLNMFLKNNQMDMFLIVLKDFLKKVPLEDQELSNDLSNIFKKISFLISFYDKLEKTIQKLEYNRQKNPELVEYIKKFSAFAWLFYVMTRREKAFTTDLVENTFLMACIVSFFVIYAWDYVRPREFEGCKFTDKKEISLNVQNHMLPNFFGIKNPNLKTYHEIYELFNDYFALLINKGYVKMSSNKEDFLSPKYLQANYKRLDHLYQGRLTPQDLDERIFIKERASNLTPSRFTPFARQGYVNKLSKPNNTKQQQPAKNFSSHRILNYDMIDKIDTTIPLKQQTQNQVKIPSNVLNSPSMFKPKLICSTPITAGMEMYNFLNEKSKKAREMNFPQRKHDSMILGLIGKVLDCTDKKNEKTKEIKSNLIFSLFKISSEQYLAQYPNEKDNQELLKSFLAVCVELVFFVSNISLSFQQIEQILDSSPIDEWKACDFFMKFDKTIPSTLKLHILDIEVNLISFKIWKDASFVETIQQIATNKFEGQDEHMERCFKRVLHQMAFQTNQLCTALGLEDYIADFVFQTLKIILSQCTKLLENRHLDQMLICSIYIHCKKEEINLKFMEIKDKYQLTNPNNKSLHEEIICKVDMGSGEPLDIIKFYNKVFRNTIVNHLQQINSVQNNSHQINSHTSRQQTSTQILKSPLRSIIPKQLGLHKMQNTTKGHQTQNATKLLYALNESPLMKFEAVFKQREAVQSKKAINFDLEEKNFVNMVRPSQVTKTEGLEEATKYLKKFTPRQQTQISKQGSEKILFADQIKPMFQKSQFDRKQMNNM